MFQPALSGVEGLSQPGTRISLSPAFAPPLLKGVKVYPENPFRLDFILDKGNSASSVDELKGESTRLIKYFLASVTVPENDLWVNLSPYEKNRIVPEAFGVTEMGRDLLAQDYMLKQITASVIYPEGEIGKAFWAKVYAEAQRRYGTSDVPVDTFNKVWIVPEKAVVYESKDSAYVVESKLKVMLEEDYLALEKNTSSKEQTAPATNKLGSDIVREVVIPILEKEVNEGKNFAQLRQVYHSLILAVWYKDKVKESIFGKAYVDQKKTDGVDIEDKAAKDKIWARYVDAFKKGAYNYIKEELDPVTQQTVPRKYFSGGVTLMANFRGKAYEHKRADRTPLSDLAMLSHDSSQKLIVRADMGTMNQPENRPSYMVSNVENGTAQEQSQKTVEYRDHEKIIKKKIKKVLLVNAALSGDGIDTRPPIGIWYIEAYLKKILGKAVEVEVLDMGTQPKNFDIRGFVLSMKPDLVGISTTCSFFAPVAYDVTRNIRDVLPNSVIVEGGVHPSVAPEDVVKNTAADFLIRGEGESALVEVISSMSEGDGNIGKTKGVWYKNDEGNIFKGGLSQQVKLDDLPMIPSLDIDISKYDLTSPYFNGERAWPLITERGCPMNCLFCSVKTMIGEKWRAMSAERVVSEIKAVVKRFGITNFYFNDDSFTLNQKRARKIAELILADKDLPPIKWKMNSRADSLTEDLVALMARAGLIHMSFGIESPDSRVLRAINKRMNTDQYRNAREWARKYNVHVRYLLMLGLPYQDARSVNLTIDFIRETKPEEMFVQIYVPLPGSEFSLHPDQFGITVPETADYTKYLSRELGSYKPTAMIRTKWMSEQELLDARERVINAHKAVIADGGVSRRDLAQSGGIDLTRDKMGIQVQGDGQGVQFKFDPAMIQQLQNASGIAPAVIDIRPMTMTVPMFLGLNDGAEKIATAH
ncbi:MAG: B12-binding domain-containing radical SAM protein [Candidatus Omnitrophica bacterium]|nr:B12-binding domain-containing radical SAM protein [Candidatus Omnitrophota bacterium]